MHNHSILTVPIEQLQPGRPIGRTTLFLQKNILRRNFLGRIQSLNFLTGKVEIPTNPTFADHHSVERLQDKVVSELGEYTASRHPGQRNRFPRLLLLLSPLRSLHPDTLEDLFFSGLIGNIQIDSVIPYILKMEPREYQNHLGAKQESPVKSEGDLSIEEEDKGSQVKVEVSLTSAPGLPPPEVHSST